MNSFKVTVRSAALVSALVLILAACAADSDPDPDALGDGDQEAVEPDEANDDADEPSEEPDEANDDADGPSEEPETVAFALALHWTVPISDWVGIIAASELGFYTDEGLDVELRYQQGSGPVVQTTGAGDSEMGVAGSDSFLTARAENLPVTAVANHFQITPTGVLVPGDLALDSPEDLRGLTIASALASPEPAMLRGMLAGAGMDPESDVDLTFVDPQAKCTVVLAGQADACTGFVNFQAVQMEFEGAEPRFMSFSTPDRPMLGHVILANDTFLAENGDAVTRFLRATMRGYLYAAENVDEIVEMYVDLAPETDEAFLRAGIQESLPLLSSPRTDEHGFGWMTDEAWQFLHDALLDGEVLPGSVDVSEIYTNDYLPEERMEWSQMN